MVLQELQVELVIVVLLENEDRKERVVLRVSMEPLDPLVSEDFLVSLVTRVNQEFRVQLVFQDPLAYLVLLEKEGLMASQDYLVPEVNKVTED